MISANRSNQSMRHDSELVENCRYGGNGEREMVAGPPRKRGQPQLHESGAAVLYWFDQIFDQCDRVAFFFMYLL